MHHQRLLSGGLRFVVPLPSVGAAAPYSFPSIAGGVEPRTPGLRRGCGAPDPWPSGEQRSRMAGHVGQSRTPGRIWALMALFVVTRCLVASVAVDPAGYRQMVDDDITGDPLTYERWATEIIDLARRPYRDVAIEYPPGALPVVVVPHLLPGRYRVNLVALLVAVDAVGLVGLLRLARRWGSPAGAWLWVVSLPLLGPVAYLRLDLVPAVVTVWALDAAAAGRWLRHGAWLGLGALAKVYPVFLLPAAAAISRRRAVVAGALLAGALGLLPFAGVAGGLARSVLGYYTQRGVQVETLWASGLLLAGRAGYDLDIGYTFGAHHIASGLSSDLKLGSTLLSVAVLGGSACLAGVLPRGDTPGLAAVWLGTLAGLLASGSVLSAQFMLWLVAAAAAALCTGRPAVRLPGLLVAPLTALTQFVYPVLYHRFQAGEPAALAVLIARNALLAVVAVLAVRAVLVERAAGHAGVPETERVPAGTGGC